MTRIEYRPQSFANPCGECVRRWSACIRSGLRDRSTCTACRSEAQIRTSRNCPADRCSIAGLPRTVSNARRSACRASGSRAVRTYCLSSRFVLRERKIPSSRVSRRCPDTRAVYISPYESLLNCCHCLPSLVSRQVHRESEIESSPAEVTCSFKFPYTRSDFSRRIRLFAPRRDPREIRLPVEENEALNSERFKPRNPSSWNCISQKRMLPSDKSQKRAEVGLCRTEMAIILCGFSLV